jgi:hypothetical protein
MHIVRALRCVKRSAPGVHLNFCALSMPYHVFVRCRMDLRPPLQPSPAHAAMAGARPIKPR